MSVSAPQLDTLRAFTNTVDFEDGVDVIATPEGLRGWLVDNGRLRTDATVGEAAHRRAIAIREGIRALAEANNGEELDRRRVDAMNRAAAEFPVTLSVAPGRWGLEAAEQADTALAGIMAIMLRAMDDGSWARVKSCRSETCRWVFLDESRNHSGTWCSMRVCGSRSKARAYRARRRDTGDA